MEEVEHKYEVPALPRKGWKWVDVEECPEHFTCEFCGNTEVRFKHTIRHPLLDKPLYVGCVCAENLCEDYTAPKGGEKAVAIQKRREKRLRKWIDSSSWKESRSGYWRRFKNTCIFIDATWNGYRVKQVRHNQGCLWEVPYSFSSFSSAAETVFKAIEDGTITMADEDNDRIW